MNKSFSFGMGCLLLAGLMATGRIGLNGQVLHADSPLPSFDVAAIRPSKGDSLRTVRSASELQMLDVTARYLIEQAYNIPWTDGSRDRIRGGPGWIDSDHYDVSAKIAPEAAATLQQMPEEQRRRQMNLRLQALLADRLKLKVHFESHQEPMFAIVTGKNGSKLTPATPSAEGQQGQGILVRYNGQAAEMTAKGVTLENLASWLTGYSEMGGQTVVNQTGLTQRYDFVLNWTREGALSNGEKSGESESPTGTGPALFTALQEQLGLKLVNSRGPVEIIVVDSIGRPTEN